MLEVCILNPAQVHVVRTTLVTDFCQCPLHFAVRKLPNPHRVMSFTGHAKYIRHPGDCGRDCTAQLPAVLSKPQWEELSMKFMQSLHVGLYHFAAVGYYFTCFCQFYTGADTPLGMGGDASPPPAVPQKKIAALQPVCRSLVVSNAISQINAFDNTTIVGEDTEFKI